MRPLLLITGASAGIGAATARLAAERGHDLLITYNSDAAGAETVAQAARTAGAQAHIQQCDVADPKAITALYATLDALNRPLAGLVNNAGIVAPTAKVTEMSHDRLRRIFDVNVIGAMLVAKEAALRMIPQGAGVIVNISSVAARLGSANQYVDYAATKGAIDTFTKGLSDELAPQGIRVAGIAPGLIETDIHAKGGDPGRLDRIGTNPPMRRPGTADEVAEAVLWLLSDQASYVTGTTLEVSGGR
ncbi:MAG: SDR family oxidoreductase [Sulfitobacter sp.]|nr:SDR family oxidoreductase [Sulfitobacter sp.]